MERLSTSLSQATVRFARAADAELILQLVRELADYEKLSHEVVADVETLRRELFGTRRIAEVVIAEVDKEPAGFALFFHNFSTFVGRKGLYVEDLYVRTAFRGMDIGRTLLSFLARLAVERSCGRMEWWVLDWNEPAIGFYKKLGAKSMDEWTVFRIDGSNLKSLARQCGEINPAG